MKDFFGNLKFSANNCSPIKGMNMKRFLLPVAATLLIVCAGCITPSAVMKSWVGHHESELVSAWGAPDSVIELQNGNKVYTWKRVRSDQYGVHQGRQSFTIDATGKAVSWSYENMPWFLRK